MRRFYFLHMRHIGRLLAAALAVLAAFSLAIQPAAAQSILRDAETEALLHDLATPLIKAAGLDPANVSVVLVGDPSINAFVAGGQTVYINSGLIGAADNANEVQGVIAHELGHITGGHVIAASQGSKEATGVTILSLVLAGLAAAAGAGDAAMGVAMAGQRAALGKYLAFTRGQESAADAAGATFLSKAGISGKGSIAFFKKLQNMQFRYGYSPKPDDEFISTHPLTGDRIANLEQVYKVDPAWNTPEDPKLEARFQRVKAKLEGYIDTPQETLRDYPPSDQSIPAHYARAYAYHKEALTDQAIAETDALIKAEPDDPYFLELEGQILLESGKPAEAIPPLRKATQLSNNSPLIATLFGHALIATEDPSHYDEAEQVLRYAVARDRDNPFAWYQLGVVYAAKGDMPRARLASAEQQSMNGQYMQALRSAQAAQAGLPENSPDWIRAQDIEFEARQALEQNKGRS
ncbi:M48 family metalloprotease [Tsuneonella mangrovi]|uniref:M48 family metalloprotease n=1 Tax=Tsuneonella mangrovi TaxID=1982042 RepID=UPI001F0AFBFE|nr:M48 family metalloprotease [Tsuneonella mangrovi]